MSSICFKLSYIFFSILISHLYKSEEITIFKYDGHIEFAKIEEFKINFKDLQAQTPNFYFEHSFLTIIANVTTDTDCTKKSSDCSQPIRIYGKINEMPRPEDILYDKKDDNGKFLGNSALYGFEYSPCQLNLNDTLHIKLVGIEGKSNYTLSVNFNYMINYKVLCAEGEKPISTLSAAVSTPIGTFQYGGKINGTTYDENLYLLKAENESKLKWSKFNNINNNNNNLGPGARFGHYMTYFENYLILFGGENKNKTILNDLWIYDIISNFWISIEYSNSKNIPKSKFLPSGELIKNHGLVLFFGGKNNFDDTNIYLLNLKILISLIDFKKSKIINIDFDYSTRVNHLWTIVDAKELIPRYGHTITQTKYNEVMFYGGFDRSDYSLSRLEIINLQTYHVKVIEPVVPSEFPYARGFHQMKKFGSIVILYGGKSGTGDNLNDIWKFIINSNKWIKVNELEKKEREFNLYKSGFIFTKLENNDRLVMYRGENRNKENSDDLILMDFEICTSDTKILSDYPCIPCSEGYAINDQKKCVGCSPGSYLNINDDFYTDSKCEKCPTGKYNKNPFQSEISSCKICGYEFYNDKVGQKECKECPENELCLPGSSSTIKDEFLLSKVNTVYQSDTNFPDFLNTNNKMKIISRATAFMIVFSITCTMLLILLISYKIRKSKVTKFLIYMDFIPLTGGQTKKCSGGLITAIYSILIISLAVSFIMRYVYLNELIEVIPIAYSNSEQDSLKSSLMLNIQLVGREFNCIDNDAVNKCSRDLEITKINQADYFSSNNIKNMACGITQEGHCMVTFRCEDCKTINTNDIIEISIKNSKSLIQLYRWSFESVWAEDFDYTKGYSRIDGIFKPDNDIKSNFVFKGDVSSNIQILLTPIFYSAKNEGIKLSGYRSSLKQYSRGSIRNELDFFKSESGVKLQIQFFYAANSYQINSKQQIEFLDFYAFILGMLAGFSFLSRISKYFCERWKIMDVSMESYQELQEDNDRKEEKLEKLENDNEKNTKSIEITNITANNGVQAQDSTINNTSANNSGNILINNK